MSATPEQKRRLLKAKIAVALRDELGRVPKEEEINQVRRGPVVEASGPPAASVRNLAAAGEPEAASSHSGPPG